MKEKIEISKECYSDLAKELKDLKKKKFEYKVKRNCQPYGSIEFMTKDQVISAFSMIRQSIKNKKEAASELGLDPEKVKVTETYNGYTQDEWKADFMTRLDQIKVNRRIGKLEKNCPELLEILSESDKKGLVLDKINSDLLSDDDED